MEDTSRNHVEAVAQNMNEASNNSLHRNIHSIVEEDEALVVLGNHATPLALDDGHQQSYYHRCPSEKPVPRGRDPGAKAASRP
jgi:hypothetical protein